MRVISKKRDYFDTAGYIDRSIVFVRKEAELEIDITKPNSLKGGGLLGFCGKFYPYIHEGYAGGTDEKTGKIYPPYSYYYYTFEDYKKSPFWEDMKKSRYYWSEANEADYVNYFNHWKDSDKPFIDLDTPYFKIQSFNNQYKNQKGIARITPNLQDMQFGQVMDAPTVFQTVQFYLSNQLVKVNDPDDIPDKYKIQQHGFDKFSFRNPTRLKDLK